jgi:glutamate carboxypeptidase
MERYRPFLDWIDSQHSRMLSLVTHWANINSGTFHHAGLFNLANVLQLDFRGLGADGRRVALPPYRTIDSRGEFVESAIGDLLTFRKRADAPLKVLLGIHYDTVYGVEHPFQKTAMIGEGKLGGPGVADAKGGIAVMLIALECLERFLGSSGTPARESTLGWEVFLNPDEEIGSPSSGAHLVEMARGKRVGLLFEPALGDGALVSERKGSGNFVVVVRGRAAHAGRNPEEGRNAIEALAQIIVALCDLPRDITHLTLNVGQVEGGGPLNIVPDLAIGRFNVRFASLEQRPMLEERLERIIASFNPPARDGIRVELHGGITAPPKVAGPGSAAAKLMEEIRGCGEELGMKLAFRPTGGVCDGNRLAAAGLATIDTLGVRGGELHSGNEFVYLDSLMERAKLTALFLMKLASGEIEWKGARPE